MLPRAAAPPRQQLLPVPAPVLQEVLLLALLALLPSAALGAVPTLDSLAADWVEAAPERDMPQISAFANQLGTNKEDLVSVNSFTHAPFVQGSSLCALRVDGEQLPPARHRWRAYEASRQATSAKGVRVTVDTRLGFEVPVVLWQLSLQATRAGEHTLSFELTPLIREARLTHVHSHPPPEPCPAANPAANPDQTRPQTRPLRRRRPRRCPGCSRTPTSPRTLTSRSGRHQRPARASCERATARARQRAP